VKKEANVALRDGGVAMGDGDNVSEQAEKQVEKQAKDAEAATKLQKVFRGNVERKADAKVSGLKAVAMAATEKKDALDKYHKKMPLFVNSAPNPSKQRFLRDEIVAHIQLMTDPNYSTTTASINATTYASDIKLYGKNVDNMGTLNTVYGEYHEWLKTMAAYHTEIIQDLASVKNQITYTMKFPNIARAFQTTSHAMTLLSQYREIKVTHRNEPNTNDEDRKEFHENDRNVKLNIELIRGMVEREIGWVKEHDGDKLIGQLNILSDTQFSDADELMGETNDALATVKRLSSTWTRTKDVVATPGRKAISGMKGMVTGTKDFLRNSDKLKNVANTLSSVKRGVVYKDFIRPNEWAAKFEGGDDSEIYNGNSSLMDHGCDEFIQKITDESVKETVRHIQDIFKMNTKMWECKTRVGNNNDPEISTRDLCDLKVPKKDLNTQYGRNRLGQLCSELDDLMTITDDATLTNGGSFGKEILDIAKQYKVKETAKDVAKEVAKSKGVMNRFRKNPTQSGGAVDTTQTIEYLKSTNDVVALISAMFADAVAGNILNGEERKITDETLPKLYQYFMPLGQIVGAPHGTEQMIQDVVEFYQIMKHIDSDYNINVEYETSGTNPDNNHIIPHLIARMNGGDDPITVPEDTKRMIDRIMEKVDGVKADADALKIDADAVEEAAKIDADVAAEAAKIDAALKKNAVDDAVSTKEVDAVSTKEVDAVSTKDAKASKPGFLSNFMSGTNASSLEHMDGNKSLKIRVQNGSLIIDIVTGDDKGIVTLPLESVFNSKHLTTDLIPGITFDDWADQFLAESSGEPVDSDSTDDMKKATAFLANTSSGSEINGR